MRDDLDFVKAWNLQTGDEIFEKSKTGNVWYVYHVIDIVRHTQTKQGQSSAVLIATKGSYSPSWRSYEASTFVQIRKRN